MNLLPIAIVASALILVAGCQTVSQTLTPALYEVQQTLTATVKAACRIDNASRGKSYQPTLQQIRLNSISM